MVQANYGATLYTGRAELIRLTSSTLQVRNTFTTSIGNSYIQSSFIRNITSVNFGINNPITFDVLQYSASGVQLVSLTIDKISS
jgi:hypothetical protein